MPHNMDELLTEKDLLIKEIAELELEKADCMNTMSQLIGTRGHMIKDVRELEEYITKLQKIVLENQKSPK